MSSDKAPSTPARVAPPWYMDGSRADAWLKRAPDAETRGQAEFFLEHGFVMLRESLSVALCDEVLAAFRRWQATNDELFQPHLDEQGHLPRIVNLHLVIPELRRLFVANTPALRFQDYLFQAETAIYTSLFYERGSAQDLHRDTPFFCTRPEYCYFGMWVALEDVDEDNGPLMVMPGGHLMAELDRAALVAEILGDVEEVPATSDALWSAYQNRVVGDGRERGLGVITLPVKKGDTIIWHPQLPHGGAPIRDLSRSRYSLVIHTTPVDTPVYHHDAFFDPHRPYSTTPGWAYLADGERRFAGHATISFNHRADHLVRDLVAHPASPARRSWRDLLGMPWRTLSGPAAQAERRGRLLRNNEG
jgi:phytanoyl-CoA hydroxylase